MEPDPPIRWLADPDSVDEADDLQQQARQLREQRYLPEDRKYHLSRSRSVHEDMAAYLRRVRRPKAGGA